MVAYRVAQQALPAYSHPFSPKTFTQHQLFACLVLKTFYKTDYRGIIAILRDSPTLCKTIHLTKLPHYTTIQKAAKRLLYTSQTHQLLQQTLKIGLKRRKKVHLAAIDSTGLEAGHTSSYYVKRRSRGDKSYQETTYKRFPKLSVVCDCHSHLILSAITRRGPCPDVHELLATLKPLLSSLHIKTLLGDAGYDSEANHCLLRDQLGIESIIPAKHGRPTHKLPKTKYRRFMKKHLDKKRYGQRWQVETVFSMIKRNLNETINAKTYWPQCREMMLLVLTHNIAILLCVTELFYRADLTPLIPPRGLKKCRQTGWT